MSSSSSNDSCSVPSSIPSPQEFSHLITESDSLHSSACIFTSKPTSTTILRCPKFLSQSISQLEEELERHRMKWKVIHNHLFNNRSFQTRIRPIVNDYRQKRALIRQGFHPYSRTSGSLTMPSANNPPSTNNSPSTENRCIRCQGEDVEEITSFAVVHTIGEEKRYTPQPHSLKVQGSRKSRRILSLAYK
jgi:hypothetical protein